MPSRRRWGATAPALAWALSVFAGAAEAREPTWTWKWTMPFRRKWGAAAPVLALALSMFAGAAEAREPTSTRKWTMPFRRRWRAAAPTLAWGPPAPTSTWKWTMLFRRRWGAAAPALAWALSVFAGAAGAQEPVRVFAAASLVDVLDAVHPVLEDAAGRPVSVSTASSATLARQILQGAPADVFISASPAWMDRVEAEGLLAAGPAGRRDWLGNRLVCVVVTDAEWAPGDIGNLADPRIASLALATESAPVGAYAREALTRARVPLPGRVVAGLNARDTLAKVALGAAAVGMVYRTDVRLEPRVRVAFAVDPALHSPIIYPAAGLARSRFPEDCVRLLAALHSAAVRETAAAHGFIPR